MKTEQYIASGLLELYVYGVLSSLENEEIFNMATRNPEIKAEIIAIEKTILRLSSSFAPSLSVAHYNKIKQKIELNSKKPIEKKANTNSFLYIGWMVFVFLLMGIGYLYLQLEKNTIQLATTTNENAALKKEYTILELKNKATLTNLALLRDFKNAIIFLKGQEIAPQSFAKLYLNLDKKVVYIDASGLLSPPEGMVYQVWALQLNPYVPTSIGTLENFTLNQQKIFIIHTTQQASAFGITLELEGGSLTPTMEKLYVLGKV